MAIINPEIRKALASRGTIKLSELGAAMATWRGVFAPPPVNPHPYPHISTPLETMDEIEARIAVLEQWMEATGSRVCVQTISNLKTKMIAILKAEPDTTL